MTKASSLRRTMFEKFDETEIELVSTDKLLEVLEREERLPKKLTWERRFRVKRYEEGNRAIKGWVLISSLGRVIKDRRTRNYVDLLKELKLYKEREPLFLDKSKIELKQKQLLQIYEECQQSKLLPLLKGMEEVVANFRVRVLHDGDEEAKYWSRKEEIKPYEVVRTKGKQWVWRDLVRDDEYLVIGEGLISTSEEGSETGELLDLLKKGVSSKENVVGEDELLRKKIEEKTREIMQQISEAEMACSMSINEEEELRTLLIETAGYIVWRRVMDSYDALIDLGRDRSYMISLQEIVINSSIKMMKLYEKDKEKRSIWNRIKSKFKRDGRKKEEKIKEALNVWKDSMRAQMGKDEDVEKKVSELFEYRKKVRPGRRERMRVSRESGKKFSEKCREAYRKFGLDIKGKERNGKIKQAYMREARKTHPDHHVGDTEEQIKDWNKQFNACKEAKDRIDRHLKGGCECEQCKREQKEREVEKWTQDSEREEWIRQNLSCKQLEQEAEEWERRRMLDQMERERREEEARRERKWRRMLDQMERERREEEKKQKLREQNRLEWEARQAQKAKEEREAFEARQRKRDERRRMLERIGRKRREEMSLKREEEERRTRERVRPTM
ncbi:MAG: hypothetical protein ABIH77_00055 [Pseudomonadota bacterium]